MAKSYEALKVKKMKNSEVEIDGRIPVEIIERHRERILEEMRKDFIAPGFRKGAAPIGIFLKQVNEIHVLEEAANLALNDAYPEIVKDEGILVFGRPQIALTKFAPKNPIEFRIRVGVVPRVKLPDYKKIAKKIAGEKEEISVSEDEIDEIVKQVKGLRATKDSGEKVKSDSDTVLTDEYVKTLGNFKDVADFMSKMRENLKREKENAIAQKKREAILNNIIDSADVDLPAIVVEDEAKAMSDRFHKNLAEKNMMKEEYLKKIGKTEEQIKKEDVAFIERELKLRIILDKIAELENIKVSGEEIDREMEFVSARHPNDDPEHLRIYIENTLRNEKLLRLLVS